MWQAINVSKGRLADIRAGESTLAQMPLLHTGSFPLRTCPSAAGPPKSAAGILRHALDLDP